MILAPCLSSQSDLMNKRRLSRSSIFFFLSERLSGGGAVLRSPFFLLSSAHLREANAVFSFQFLSIYLPFKGHSPYSRREPSSGSDG